MWVRHAPSSTHHFHTLSTQMNSIRIFRMKMTALYSSQLFKRSLAAALSTQTLRWNSNKLCNKTAGFTITCISWLFCVLFRLSSTTSTTTNVLLYSIYGDAEWCVCVCSSQCKRLPKWLCIFRIHNIHCRCACPLFNNKLFILIIEINRVRIDTVCDVNRRIDKGNETKHKTKKIGENFSTCSSQRFRLSHSVFMFYCRLSVPLCCCSCYWHIFRNLNFIRWIFNVSGILKMFHFSAEVSGDKICSKQQWMGMNSGHINDDEDVRWGARDRERWSANENDFWAREYARLHYNDDGDDNENYSKHQPHNNNDKKNNENIHLCVRQRTTDRKIQRKKWRAKRSNRFCTLWEKSFYIIHCLVFAIRVRIRRIIYIDTNSE